MDKVVEISQVIKRYQDITVLKGLSMHIERGEVVGMLGNNGAGKTTLIEAMLGFTSFDSGNCQLFSDQVPNLSGDTRHKIGYVPQVTELVPWMRVDQIINYTQSFYNTWDQNFVDRLLVDFSLGHQQRVEKLSIGQRQKLAIALALGHHPELLVLDEPVASLDPSSRRDFIKHIIDMNLEYGTTVLFSTHITSDLERVAAKIILIKDGINYYQGDIDALKEKFIRLHMEFKEGVNKPITIPGLLQLKVSGKYAIAFVSDGDNLNINQLGSQLNANIRVEQLNLEDIFIEVNKK